MRTAFLLILPSALLRTVSAFTNGALLPSYLCDLTDLANGSPTSLGVVVPLLVEDDSQAKIAGYHHVTGTNYSAQDLCVGGFAKNGSTYSATSNDFIVKTIGGEKLSKSCSVQVLLLTVADGLLVWIQDYPTGQTTPRRIGTFTAGGLNMMIYPYKCGETLVHQTVLDDEAAVASQSDTMTWVPPAAGVFGTFVEVRGVCVTLKGYGKFQTQIPTNGVGSATI